MPLLYSSSLPPPPSHLPPGSLPFCLSSDRHLHNKLYLKSSESHCSVGIAITQDGFVSHPKPLLLIETGASKGPPSLHDTPESMFAKAERGRSCVHCLDSESLATIHGLPVFLNPLQREVSGGSSGICGHGNLFQSLDQAQTPIHSMGKDVSERGDENQ